MPASRYEAAISVEELLPALPVGTRKRLRAAAEAAEATGSEVAWVGGGVRELLRDPGTAAVDLDLVIEGELEPFIARLAGSLRVSRVVRSRFLTAELELASGERLDVARARRERYASPAALPEVEPANLECDLVRRDFTVNSLAIRLRPTAGAAGISGSLIDPTGGQVDLAAKRLRVQHPRSFVDDPTRIFRGIDFEARLGMRFDAETELLVRAPEALGSLERLSAARLRGVLRRAFGRPESSGRALERAAELGLLPAIHPELRWRPGDREAFESAVAGLTEHGEETAGGSDSVLLLALCLLSLDTPGSTRVELARRLDLDAKSRRVLVDGLDRLVATRLAAECRPSFAHRSLAPMGEIELALFAGRGPVEAAWVKRERLELRPLRLTIDGQQLLDRGVARGPAIGAALEKTLDARLDGSIGRELELDFALAEAARRGAY